MTIYSKKEKNTSHQQGMTTVAILLAEIEQPSPECYVGLGLEHGRMWLQLKTKSTQRGTIDVLVGIPRRVRMWRETKKNHS